MQFETLAIHGGQSHDPSTGAVMTPVYFTSTYAQKSPGEHLGYEYSRTHNPTRKALEQALASLENAQHGFCFASGCAAMSAVLMCLKSGDEIVAMDDLYGGSNRLLRLFSRFGIHTRFIDLTKENLDSHITPHTKLIWIETPTNPMLKIVDLKQVCAQAKKHQIPVLVDNTFATPYLQRPLDLGATLSLHSTTKYLGGHSDVLGGAILTNDATWAKEIAFISNATGGVLGPMDAFLTLRGVKTLAVRMDRHIKNALQIAQFLKSHKQVERVIYPGLLEHPEHALSKSQMKGPGGMISFYTKTDALAFIRKLRIFTCAESLGGVESLVEHPAIMTHASIPKEQRIQLGILDNFIRLSIGIESGEDLIQDLEGALS